MGKTRSLLSLQCTTFVFLMQERKYANITADSENCFDLSGLISAVSGTDIYSKRNKYSWHGKDFLLVV